MFKDLIPYTPNVLATVVRHQVGTVEKAMQIFQDLGLIEILDNGAIYMLDIQNFIGESSTEADRIRDYRNKIKQEKLKGLPERTNVQQESRTNVQQKYTRDRDREVEVKRGRFIPPTIEDVSQYCKERGNSINAEQFINYYQTK